MVELFWKQLAVGCIVTVKKTVQVLVSCVLVLKGERAPNVLVGPEREVRALYATDDVLSLEVVEPHTDFSDHFVGLRHQVIGFLLRYSVESGDLDRLGGPQHSASFNIVELRLARLARRQEHLAGAMALGVFDQFEHNIVVQLFSGVVEKILVENYRLSVIEFLFGLAVLLMTPYPY